MAYIGKGVIGVEHPSTSALTATSVTSTGAISGTTGTFSGAVGVTGITTATGGLNVGTIKDAGNNATAMTIDSSGRVLTPARPAFLARRNDTTTSVSSTNIFPFDSVSVYGGFDTASGYNTSTYTYTCPVAGLYHFHVSAIIGSATYSNAQWKIQLNSSDYEQRHFSSTNSDYYTHSMDTYINASANDTVRIKAGTNLTFYGNQWSVFMGHLIG
jgi:hypothetical protein